MRSCNLNVCRGALLALVMCAAAAPALAQAPEIDVSRIYLGSPAATLHSGSGAPSASAPSGSMYFRTDTGQWYQHIAGAWRALTDANGVLVGSANLTDLSASGSVDATGNVFARQGLYIGSDGAWLLNKSGSGWLNWAVRNTSGSESTLDLQFLGPIGAHLMPATHDAFHVGRADRIWREAWIGQLHSLVFSASTQTIFGGYNIIGKGAGTLASLVTPSDTSIDFGRSMTATDWVEIRAHDTSGDVKVEYLQVGALVSGTTYAVTRDLAGAHGTDPEWAAGTPFLVLGSAGDGRIAHLAAGPRTIWGQQGVTHDAFTPRVVVGNLDGFFGYSSRVFGLAAGDPAAAWIKIDPTNGLRIGHGSTTKISLDASGSAVITGPDITLGTAASYLSSNALKFARPSNHSGVFDLYSVAGSGLTDLYLENDLAPAFGASQGRIILRARSYSVGPTPSNWASLTLTSLSSNTVSAAQLVADQIALTGTTSITGALSTSSAITERNRATPLGEWQSVAYNSGHFSASAGTWTVESADQEVLGYTLVGKTMTVTYRLTSTSVSAAPGALRVAIPGGFTAARSTLVPIGYAADAGTIVDAYASVGSGGTLIVFNKRTAANWSTATNSTDVIGQITFEIQ
ncbi:MAG TPA: hypothetical protein VM364_00515 [Vicinamibacterales bacterium]|nr:hypothetical protein [Vicinamibacterales bacterium]